MMFSLNSRMRSSSSALRAELLVEPPFSIAVATCPATALSRREVLGAERLAAFLPPERHHRDRAVLGDARHEVVQPVIAPERDLVGRETADGERIVEAHRLTRSAEAGPDCRSDQRRERRDRIRRPALHDRVVAASPPRVR